MKCICIRDCHLRHETERPIFYNRGDIVDFEKCPSHFSPIEEAFTQPESAPKLNTQQKMMKVKPTDGAFDFSTATEEVLMAGSYEVGDLISFAKIAYGADLPAGEEKATTVARFVDARYRASLAQAQKAEATKNVVK